MPNTKAREEHYCKGFGLSAQEFEFIRSLPAHSRCFLVRQANRSVVVRLDLQRHAGGADGAVGPRIQRSPPRRDPRCGRRRSGRLVSDADPRAVAGLAAERRRLLAGSRRMSQCAPFGADGPAGIADALSKVDCLANDATAMSFGRLFGAHGSFSDRADDRPDALHRAAGVQPADRPLGAAHFGADAADDDARPGADLRDFVDRLSVGGLEPRDRRAGRNRQRAGRDRKVRPPRYSRSSSTDSSSRSPMPPARSRRRP